MLDRVGAGRGERRAHDFQARPGNDTFVDRVAQRHVVVARAFGFEVAHRREAVLEPDLERPHGADDPVRRVLLEDLLVVFDGGGIALQEDVRVGVDEAGEQHPVAEVDDVGSGRNRLADALDPIPDDDDDGLFDVAPGLHVEEARGPDRDRRRRRFRRVGGPGHGDKGDRYKEDAAQDGRSGSFRHSSSPKSWRGAYPEPGKIFFRFP